MVADTFVFVAFNRQGSSGYVARVELSARSQSLSQPSPSQPHIKRCCPNKSNEGCQYTRVDVLKYDPI